MLAVEAQDPEPLVRVPGIGRKTAERVLIDLRDRVKELAAAAAQPSALAGRAGSAQSEAFGALIALGYKPVEVTRLLKSVSDEGGSVEELIRRALRAAAG